MFPRRAASWVYDVINVLIDALDVEVSLLSRGNLSWRFYDQELEHIRPAVDYLNRNGRHILRDLIAAKPAIEALIAKHDELRQRVESTATVVHGEAIRDPALHAAVARARKAFLDQFPDAVPTGAFASDKHVDLVIERLINRIEDPPPHHTDAEFWSLHRRDFAFFRPSSLPLLDRLRGEFLAFDRASIKDLEALSLQICAEHDIPAAPSESVHY